MATLLESFADSSGHWYSKDGSPAYMVKGKNGKDRATTLRDARELGLVPSVTTIMQMEAKPALERWKIEQAMLACLTLPRAAGEDEGAFMARALQDSREQARKAAERGTYIHGLIERAIGGFQGQFTDGWDIVSPVLDFLQSALCIYTWYPERSFSAESYGGKIDLFGVHRADSVVIDFKCKTALNNQKTLAYPEHITQLSAYANGLQAPGARCINLFIDADVPGLIVAKEWTAEERDNGWEAFQCLLRLWQIRKGYKP